MSGLRKASVLSAAFVAAIFLNGSAKGVVVLNESFDTDPAPRGWSGVGNATAPNNYGFSNTDNTGNSVNPPGGTATGAGEIGGTINRGPNSFYGVDLGGPVNFATTDMNVRGVLQLASRGSSTTLNLGWSLGIATANGVSGEVGAGLFMSWDDGNNGSNGMKARGNGFGISSATGPSLIAGGPTVPFEMDWKAATRTFTMDVNGAVGTLVISAGDIGDLPSLTHWGMWGRTNATPDNANVLWIDDLSFTSVPEPASLGLLAIGGLIGLRRRK